MWKRISGAYCHARAVAFAKFSVVGAHSGGSRNCGALGKSQGTDPVSTISAPTVAAVVSAASAIADAEDARNVNIVSAGLLGATRDKRLSRSGLGSAGWLLNQLAVSEVFNAQCCTPPREILKSKS